MKIIIREQNEQSQEEQYDVEKIVGERKKGNLTLYKVKWLGYPIQQSTWQPYSNLKNTPEKIRQWKKQKYRKQVQKEMKEQLRAMNYNQNNSSSDITQNKRYKSQQIKSKNAHCQTIKKQIQAKNTQIASKNYKKSNDISGDNQSFEQNPKTSKKKKTKLQRVEQDKDVNKQMVINRSKSPQISLNQQTEISSIKVKKISRQKDKESKRLKKKSPNRNTHLQYNETKQKIVIEISDSQSNLPMIDNEEEIIVEESVSYSSESKQKLQIIDPQFFLNKETIKHKNQGEKCSIKSTIIKNKKIVSNKKESRQIQMSFFQEDIQRMPQPGLMQKILSQEGNLNVVTPQKETKVVDYEQFTDIDTIRKIDGTIYCTVIAQNGRAFSQIPYESIFHLRNDLIEKFFTIKK